ncbi:hypothetical protein [Agreia sp.]|uniref:hypothetical protein n=1 Tax=Agreia sp. TaxID=1872416 RepID=UPI0035BBF3E1
MSTADRVEAGRATYAKNFGVTPDEAETMLADLMILLTAYVGQPAPSVAMSSVLSSAPQANESSTG